MYSQGLWQGKGDEGGIVPIIVRENRKRGWFGLVLMDRVAIKQILIGGIPCLFFSMVSVCIYV